MRQYHASLHKIGSMEQPLVSICIISYNQALFIAQAIESALMQDCNFLTEIVIADDCSTDGTSEIINRYSEKHPLKIRVLPGDKNLGPAKNFARLIASAKGKYIAYLEGDDYWTEKRKLRKQIAILESNPQFVSCFTNALETFSEDVNDKRNFLQNGCNPKSVIGFKEMIYINYIQTSTLVFRNNLLPPFADWYFGLNVGDWPMHLMLSKFGDSFYIDEVMSIHRNHSLGTWSSRTKLQRIEETLKMYNQIGLNTWIGKTTDFRKAKSNVLLSAVKYCFQEKKILKAVNNFIMGVLLYPKNLFEKSYHS